MESGNRTAEKHNNLDDFINGHLGYFGENNLSRASLDHFRETGKLSGTFRAAIHAMLLDYAKLREIGNAIIYGSPTPDASQQCASLKEENERLQEAVRTANVEEQFFKVEIIENPFIQSVYPIKKKWGVKFTIGVQTFTLSVQRTKKEATWFADCLTNALTQITRKVK
jgi:hypothetical protein